MEYGIKSVTILKENQKEIHLVGLQHQYPYLTMAKLLRYLVQKMMGTESIAGMSVYSKISTVRLYSLRLLITEKKISIRSDYDLVMFVESCVVQTVR